MEANIILNNGLSQAFKSSTTTQKKSVFATLKKLANRKRLNLMDIEGKIQFKEDYNYKKMRLAK